MFSIKFKRCVASLLLIVLVSGIFFPLTAQARRAQRPVAGGGSAAIDPETNELTIDLENAPPFNPSQVQMPSPNWGNTGNNTTSTGGNTMSSGMSNLMNSLQNVVNSMTTAAQNAQNLGGLNTAPGTPSGPDRMAGNTAYQFTLDLINFGDHNTYTGLPDDDSNATYVIGDEKILANLWKDNDVNGKYDNWLSGTADFSAETYQDMLNKVADIAGSENYQNVENMDPDDPLASTLNHLSVYESGNRVVQYGTLGHYMLMSFMTLTNPDYFKDKVTEVQNALSPAIGTDSISEMPLYEIMELYELSNRDDKYIVEHGDQVFNPSNLGILLFTSTGTYDTQSATEPIDVLSKYALTYCLEAYHNIITEIKVHREAGTITSPEAEALLRYALVYNNIFGELLPYIPIMYNFDLGDGKSAADYVEEQNITDDVNDFTDTLTNHTFTSSLHDDTLFDELYHLNSDIPIVSVDRDVILNDIEVNGGFDEILAAELERQHKQNTMAQENIFKDENQITPEVMQAYGYDIAIMNNLEDIQTAIALSEEMVTESGQGIHSSAVAPSKWIQEGIKYSSTYIPMRTNIYDQNMIEKYDDDFLQKFFYKYGYNRKALYIDTSGTSAVDFYNSHGTIVGTKRIATLRDLLECGENDVTLYIDGNFYNADEAIQQGNAMRDTRNNVLKNLAEDLGTVLEACQMLPWDGEWWLSKVGNWLSALFVTVDAKNGDEISLNEFYNEARDSMLKRYKFDLNVSKTEVTEMAELANEVENGYLLSTGSMIDEVMLKTNGYTSYSDNIMTLLSQVDDPNYKSVELDNEPNDELTEDNKDTIVMPSSFIKRYMDSEFYYSTVKPNADKTAETITRYSGYATYTPLAGLAFVSLLYRSAEYYSLNNAVMDNNPVFMASDDLCGIISEGESNQWYRNSLLNWALLKNIRANVQIDYTYCVDLDCPVYMDVFGNILTESGMVVIPAAANATLHTAAFKDYNVASALYSVYGKLYSVPTSCVGAYSVLHPFFVADKNAEVYTIAPITISVNGLKINFDKVNLYDDATKSAIQSLYINNVRTSNETTRYNWIAMVNIINEVLRGAPIDNIDKVKENLYGGQKSQSATVAAIKYESLLESLRGSMQNTLISIPNFATMDGIEYYVALLIKFMIVATTAVIIILIYRDGVAGQLGLRTMWRSLAAIALTFVCIVVTPAVFQLTYYAANKLALEKEAFRILMLNEEKRQTGMEVGMTSANSTDKDDQEFLIQLDWLSVPWYKEIEHVLYGNTVAHVTDAKLEAYSQSPVFSNSDVLLQNDGVFVSTSKLFDSVNIEYTYIPTSTGASGMFFWNDGSEQSASFYMPYYVFLQSIVANVNEFNAGRPGKLGNENYTNKLMSGNRQKTVGLSYNYFNSTAFMEEDLDILRLFQIYMDANAVVPEGIDAEMDIRWMLDLYGNEIEIDPDTGEAIDAPEPPEFTAEEAAFVAVQPQYTIGQIQRQLAQAEEYAFDRALIFNDEDREAFKHCLWYNTKAVHGLADRVKALDAYAREFVANNHDLMTKVTDETFIKVLALYMSVKYNQLFGIESANALEIYNLGTEDLLRLCLLDSNEAALSVSMSFPRLVYNYGGEASVYLAAILSVILWVGSFIKPLCTVIVFISVFLSIWVFRVLLRRPSANLFGYLITVALLCLTNLLHALLLKVSVFLPNTGLSLMGCLVFMVLFQVAYLLVLAYVTGVALKDWSNLGYAEYEKEALRAKAKFSKNEAVDNLNGRIKHHDDNWDYYNDLVKQHRSRNA